MVTGKSLVDNLPIVDGHDLGFQMQMLCTIFSNGNLSPVQKRSKKKKERMILVLIWGQGRGLGIGEFLFYHLPKRIVLIYPNQYGNGGTALSFSHQNFPN